MNTKKADEMVECAIMTATSLTGDLVRFVAEAGRALRMPEDTRRLYVSNLRTNIRDVQDGLATARGFLDAAIALAEASDEEPAAQPGAREEGRP